MLTLLPDNHPTLRKVAEPVDDAKFKEPANAALRSTCMELLMTMQMSGGIGLAAPQVGISQRIITTGFYPFILINPEITKKEGTQTCEEGCLSFPGQFYNIERAANVLVKYQDFNGIWHEIADVGLNAVVLQHEIDHLNGILFVDYVKQQEPSLTQTA